MYRCESWAIKKAECWRIDAFEWWCWRRLLSPLDWKEIKLVYPKGNQPWIFIERTDAEAEVPILWPPDAKSRLMRKDPDAGTDWGQVEKGAEDEMVGWHYQLNGHESEQTSGDSEGQGSLVCCSPWGHKESDMTEWLKNCEWILVSAWKCHQFVTDRLKSIKTILPTTPWSGQSQHSPHIILLFKLPMLISFTDRISKWVGVLSVLFDRFSVCRPEAQTLG